VPSLRAGHLKHRLRQAEQTEIAGIMPEHPDDAPAGIPGDLRPGPDAERRGAGGYRRRQLRRRALLAGSLGGRYPKHVVLGWLYILRSVAFAAYFVAPPTASNTLLFAAVMGLLWFPGVWPLLSGMVAEMFGTRYMATLLGISFVVHQVGASLGAWGGGIILDVTGSYDDAWKIGVSVGFAAGIVQIVAGGPVHPREARGEPQLVST